MKKKFLFLLILNHQAIIYGEMLMTANNIFVVTSLITIQVNPSLIIFKIIVNIIIWINSKRQSVYTEKSAQDKRDGGTTSYWDFKFSIATLIMGQTSTNFFAGKFYFETEKGSIYTFDNNGQDFVYDKQAAVNLLAKMQQDLNF